MKKNMKQFPLYISVEKFKELEKEANERDLTINALIKSKLFPGNNN